MKKNGFTLVELLAVIAILAILVIIAMPNVLDMFNKAKQDAFETEVRSHIKVVNSEFITSGNLVYSNVVDGATKLPMDGEKLDYYVVLDSRGNIKMLNVTNGDYKVSVTGTSTNPIKVEQIGDTIKSEVVVSGEKFVMNSDGSISGNSQSSGNVTLITFTVGSVQYQAEAGMTWRDWLDSKYDSLGASLYTNVNGPDDENVNVAGGPLSYVSNRKNVYLGDVIFIGFPTSIF